MQEPSIPMSIGEVGIAIGAVALGILMAIIYVHYAWYVRGSEDVPVWKGAKVKVLLLLCGQGGVSYLITMQWTSASTDLIVKYANVATIVGVVVILAVLCMSAWIMGWSRGMNCNQRHQLGIQCAVDFIFNGWKYVKDQVNKMTDNIHDQSKRDLLLMSQNMCSMLKSLKKRDEPGIDFESSFKAVFGIILTKFFQHANNGHPEFCATYYRFHNQTKTFEMVARVLGENNYRGTGCSQLGQESFAMKVLETGRHAVYPDDLKKLGLNALNPPLRKRPGKKVKKFVAIPVPYNQSTYGQRKGVICVDTCRKDAWQFDDDYHLGLLFLGVAMADALHDVYLCGNNSGNKEVI